MGFRIHLHEVHLLSLSKCLHVSYQYKSQLSKSAENELSCSGTLLILKPQGQKTKQSSLRSLKLTVSSYLHYVHIVTS